MTTIIHRIGGDYQLTDLARLNSMTKYPSILTYHGMEGGKLVDQIQVPFDAHDDILVTEKVDGTNARIIFFPGESDSWDYLIGSREDILLARGDRIGNPAMGVVTALEDTAEVLANFFATQHSLDGLLVVYGEVYGGSIGGNAKQYTGTKATGFRVFDMISMESDTVRGILDREPAAIAAWRDSGGQGFVSAKETYTSAVGFGLDTVPIICPPLQCGIPTTLGDTYAWMQEMIPTTLAALDDGAHNRPEGLVIRTSDRKRIAKLRFEDYAKALRKR